MLGDKIFNNSFDNVEYGVERTTQASIQISPFVEKQYEESVSENIDELYVRRRLMQIMYELYLNSEFFEKYGQKQHIDASKDSSALQYDDLVYNPVLKKIERGDLFKIYYYFKDELQKRHEFSIIQIFCTIAEFFDLNYKTLYNDILTLEDKVNILEHLEKEYGLDKHFARSKALF
jgi:hypothetical protein